MMFCVHCGQQLPDEAKFCCSCGNETVAGKSSFSAKTRSEEGVSKIQEGGGSRLFANR